jgi:hypothetical protein
MPDSLRAYLVTFHTVLRDECVPKPIPPSKIYAATSRDRAYYLAAKDLVDSGISYCLGDGMRRISYLETYHSKDTEALAKGTEGAL